MRLAAGWLPRWLGLMQDARMQGYMRESTKLASAASVCCPCLPRGQGVLFLLSPDECLPAPLLRHLPTRRIHPPPNLIKGPCNIEHNDKP
eukprot:scaffold243338_cov31-Tisochrysis_lutea.AAC.4